MTISSTLVMKSSESSSFLTKLEYSDTLQPTPAFSLTGTALRLLFYGGLVLERPTFLLCSKVRMLEVFCSLFKGLITT